MCTLTPTPPPRPPPSASTPPPQTPWYPKDSQGGDKTRVRHDNAMDHVSNCDLQFMALSGSPGVATSYLQSSTFACRCSDADSRMLSSRRRQTAHANALFDCHRVCCSLGEACHPCHPAEENPPNFQYPTHPIYICLWLFLSGFGCYSYE